MRVRLFRQEEHPVRQDLFGKVFSRDADLERLAHIIFEIDHTYLVESLFEGNFACRLARAVRAVVIDYLLAIDKEAGTIVGIDVELIDPFFRDIDQ